MSLNPSKLIVALQNNNPQPADIIKHPFTFEFLGLKAKDTVEETDLEQALIDRLQEFLLELLCKGLHNISYANKFIMQSDLN